MALNLLIKYVSYLCATCAMIESFVSLEVSSANVQEKESNEQSALQEALLLVELLKIKYKQAVESRTCIPSNGITDHLNHHTPTTSNAKSSLANIPKMTVQDSSSLPLTAQESPSFTRPSTVLPLFSKADEIYEFSRPQQVPYFQRNAGQLQRFHQNYEFSRRQLAPYFQPNPSSRQQYQLYSDNMYEFSRLQPAKFFPITPGRRQRVRPARRLFNPQAYYYYEFPKRRSYDDYFLGYNRRQNNDNPDQLDENPNSTSSSPATVNPISTSLPARTVTTAKLNLTTSSATLTNKSISKEMKKESTNPRSAAFKAKVSTTSKRNSTTNTRSTSANVLQSQVASEVDIEVKDLPKFKMWKKHSSPSRYKPRRGKFNYTASLRIFLGHSKRYSVPLPENNALCYYNPDNALCRTFI